MSRMTADESMPLSIPMPTKKKQKFSGTAGQQRFGTDEVKNTLMPIPPQAEQERICLKIKKMLQCIEKDES